MSRAEERALEAYPIDSYEGHDDMYRQRGAFAKGYEQSEKDLIKKAKQWFTEHTNIPYEVETNKDGEPLADSYIQYDKARLDAANEMFENFKQFITEN